ncbi:hypothetical protein CUPS4256_08225 [Campylobacter upsaliensis]|uniref:hypothetical protein n=1 Tax=Campylobacter upsaliensis TaxID=28080 RepID=UPI00214A4749|nr:hypothetical protein [Campylobacter upsaliensis]MCR2103225.1 hypothetical protein [Campylobacter upsaliensis]
MMKRWVESDRKLALLAKKEIVVDGRDAHTPYTQAQSLDGRLVENNISSATNDTIPQTPKKSQATTNTLMKEMLKMQESISLISRAKDFLKDDTKDNLQKEEALQKHKQRLKKQ